MKKIGFYNLFTLVGIVVGIYSVVRGISICDGIWGYARNEITFGADFYTEMYGVTESIRGNTQITANAVKEGIGTLLIILGLMDICAFGYKFTKDINSLIQKENDFSISGEEKE